MSGMSELAAGCWLLSTQRAHGASAAAFPERGRSHESAVAIAMMVTRLPQKPQRRKSR